MMLDGAGWGCPNGGPNGVSLWSLGSCPDSTPPTALVVAAGVSHSLLQLLIPVPTPGRQGGVALQEGARLLMLHARGYRGCVYCMLGKRESQATYATGGLPTQRAQQGRCCSVAQGSWAAQVAYGAKRGTWVAHGTAEGKLGCTWPRAERAGLCVVHEVLQRGGGAAPGVHSPWISVWCCMQPPAADILDSPSTED